MGFKWLLGVFLTFLFLFSFADFSFPNIPYLNNFIIFISFVLGMILGFLSPPVVKEIYINNKRKKIYKIKNNLIEKEKIINKRIKELKLREENIESTLKRVGNGKTPKLLEIKKQLLSAREMISSQFLRYGLQKRKIEIVRMQNNISPVFSNRKLTSEEVEKYLYLLDKNIEKVYRLEQEYSQHDSYDIPNNAKLEQERLLSELSETESSFEKIREVLLAKQATFAFKELNSNQENLMNSKDLEELSNDSAVFNIQTSITDFSESFEELEREYKNLEIKSELDKNLLND